MRSLNSIYRNSSIDNAETGRGRYIHLVLNQQRELFFGLIRIHVLAHASQEPIFGLGMMEELSRHGYRLSPGTIYPILHQLEEAGYLKSQRKLVGGRIRRGYAITSQGRKELKSGRHRVRELFGELFEDEGNARNVGGKKVSRTKKRAGK